MNQSIPINHDPFRTTPRTWRSNIFIGNLSIPMKKALREALRNKRKVNCNKGTLSALVARNLCAKDCSLTNEGRIVALEESSLLQQIKSLSLSIHTVELKLDKKEHPEPSVLKYLLNSNLIKSGCYGEGLDIKILLSCMCFDVICDAWRTHSISHPQYKEYHLSFGEGAVKSTIKSNTYTNPIGSIDLLDLMENRPGTSAENRPSPYKYLVNPILSAILSASKDKIKRAFITLKKWHHSMGWAGDKWPWTNYVGLTLPFIIELYEALGNKLLYEIARTYFTDPSAFCVGWPDITIIDHNKNARLYEVKTSDKLMLSQIITISEMSNFFPVEVVKVKKY